MTTIYTTNRCITVKDTFDMIVEFMQRDEQKVIELVEVVTICSEMSVEIYSYERKILLNKQFIVEVSAS